MSLGGYSLPFYFFGIVTIICLPYIKNMNINTSEEDKDKDKDNEDEEGFFIHLLDSVIKYI